MKSNELRIGNFVIFEQTTHIITEIGSDVCRSVWHRKNPGEIYIHTYDEIKPIPLTDIILERSGFEYDNDTKKFTLLFSLTKYDFCFEINTHDNEFYYFIDGRKLWFEYVHQLQNLFFCLTGEELIIKS